MKAYGSLERAFAFVAFLSNKAERRKIKMNKMSSITKCVTTAVCIALCVVLPVALHAIPNAGKLFSPMHIPVLLCGLVCGWQYGLVCGLVGPLFSSMLTSMPPMGSITLYSMLIELAVYGLIAGLFMKLLHTGKTAADVYISLIAAMLIGRVAGGLAHATVLLIGFLSGDIVNALSSLSNAYSFKTWAAAYFVSGLPGIIVHLIVVPALYFSLQKAHLVPARYAKTDRKTA